MSRGPLPFPARGCHVCGHVLRLVPADGRLARACSACGAPPLGDEAVMRVGCGPQAGPGWQKSSPGPLLA